jgi:ribose transport system substrate-binding protein
MRKFLCLSLAAVLCAASLAGCSGSKSTGGSSSSSGSSSGSKKLTFSLITMDTIDQYWLSMKAGAQKEADSLGVTLRFDAPVGKTDAQAQADMVANAVSRGVDGIMLAANDKEALAPAVEKAYAAKIPVVYVDSPASSAHYIASFATDNHAAAGQAADQMAKLIGNAGQVAIVNAQQGAGTTELREQGFKDEMTAKYPNIKVVTTVYSDGEADKAMDETKNLLATYPQLKGIFACNEGATIGVAQGLTQSNVTGKVSCIGFDLSDNVKADIKAGSVQGCMLQNPGLMGSDGVKTLADYINNKTSPSPKDNDTGITYVTKDNVDTVS